MGTLRLKPPQLLCAIIPCLTKRVAICGISSCRGERLVKIVPLSRKNTCFPQKDGFVLTKRAFTSKNSTACTQDGVGNHIKNDG